MSEVQQQDFDMIHAKLSQWREDPGVEGFACILIARRSKKELGRHLNVASMSTCINHFCNFLLMTFLFYL